MLVRTEKSFQKELQEIINSVTFVSKIKIRKGDGKSFPPQMHLLLLFNFFFLFLSFFFWTSKVLRILSTLILYLLHHNHCPCCSSLVQLFLSCNKHPLTHLSQQNQEHDGNKYLTSRASSCPKELSKENLWATALRKKVPKLTG